MALIVQKYGGTSVGDMERISHVAKRIRHQIKLGNQIVVTVSAMSGETNRLVKLACLASDEPTPRELDVLLSTGEQVTISLLTMTLHELGIDAVSYTGHQVSILTDNAHTKARIKSIQTEKMEADLKQSKVIVVAGFQGMDHSGNITTLGRGGSDTTAVALAAVLKADECQIFTDVDGVYTTDPRIVPQARHLSTLTYDEMLEMSSLGAKVLQIRSVEFASKYSVPLRVLSSFTAPDEVGNSTLITSEDKVMEQALISGIAFNRDEAKLTILGVPDMPGIAHKILVPISDANIEVDMIIQNVSAEGATDFTCTVHRNDYDRAIKILQDVAIELDAREAVGDQKIVKVSLIGVGMRSHAGIASKMFRVLADEGINIRMIATSEIKISVVIDEKYLELAVRALHTAFDLDVKS